MTTVRIDVSKAAPSILADHEELVRRAVSAIRVTTQIEGVQIAVDETHRASPRAPIDRGRYIQGWTVDEIDGGAVLYNKTQYASVIEFGRRPNSRFPPVQLIREWVARKGLTGKMGVTAFRRASSKWTKARASSSSRQQANAIKSAAFLIGRSIAKNGIKGKFILQKTTDRLTREVVKAVILAIQ